MSSFTYFNYGGQGVLHPSVLETIKANYERIEQLGAYSNAANAWIEEEKEATRSVLAELLQVKTETITLTQNTTDGCNIALWSYPWQPGDHLLLSDCEHPGIVAIAQTLVKRFGISFSFFPLFNDRDSKDERVLEVIYSHLTPQTKMIMVSHICWNTGQILPLPQIACLCHDRGLWLAVDGAQSVGVLPLNLTELGVDFYAFTGHKWLNGPLGLGGLYVNPDRLDQALPTFVGWRGLKKKQLKFEVASIAYPLLGALRTAIAIESTWGNITERYQTIVTKATDLWTKLNQLSTIKTVCSQPPRSGLVSFQIADRSADKVSLLLEEKYQIYLRSIPHPSALRASVSYKTTEIDYLIHSLKEICNRT